MDERGSDDVKPGRNPLASGGSIDEIIERIHERSAQAAGQGAPADASPSSAIADAPGSSATADASGSSATDDDLTGEGWLERERHSPDGARRLGGFEISDGPPGTTNAIWARREPISEHDPGDDPLPPEEPIDLDARPRQNRPSSPMTLAAPLNRAAKASAGLLVAIGGLFGALTVWFVITFMTARGPEADVVFLVPVVSVPGVVLLVAGVAALRGGRSGLLIGSVVALVSGLLGITGMLGAPAQPGAEIVVLVWVIVSLGFLVAAVVLFRARTAS